MTVSNWWFTPPGKVFTATDNALTMPDWLGKPCHLLRSESIVSDTIFSIWYNFPRQIESTAKFVWFLSRVLVCQRTHLNPPTANNHWRQNRSVWHPLARERRQVVNNECDWWWLPRTPFSLDGGVWRCFRTGWSKALLETSATGGKENDREKLASLFYASLSLP